MLSMKCAFIFNFTLLAQCEMRDDHRNVQPLQHMPIMTETRYMLITLNMQKLAEKCIEMNDCMEWMTF